MTSISPVPLPLTRPAVSPDGRDGAGTRQAGLATVPLPRLLAAVTSATAGLLHVVAAQTHLDGPLIHAVGFAVVGGGQLYGAAWLVRRSGSASPSWPAALHVCALVVWALARAVGLPGLHDHGVGVADATVVLSQVATLVLLAQRPGQRTAPTQVRLGRLAVLPALAVVAILGNAAVADLAEHRHAGAPGHTGVDAPAGTTAVHDH